MENKTAKEMFEEYFKKIYFQGEVNNVFQGSLGNETLAKGYQIKGVRGLEIDTQIAILEDFHTNKGKYIKIDVNTLNDGKHIEIDFELFKAIQKQIEELGLE